MADSTPQNSPRAPRSPLLFSGDSWATGKWGRADATGVFRELRREAGMNCVRFAIQARYVKSTPDARVADGLDLKGPKFWAATHSPETTYRDILDECQREGFEPFVTLLTSEEHRPTGSGSLPTHLGEPVGRWQTLVPKTLAELTAWELFCEETAEAFESQWPGLVTRFEVWNGFQGCGTPAAFALLVRHAATGLRRAIADAKVIPNPAGVSPPNDPERQRRIAHLLQHCGDCLDGVSYQLSTASTTGAQSLPQQIRQWANELASRDEFEVWQSRWRFVAPADVAIDRIAEAMRREAADHTGLLHANVFGMRGPHSGSQLSAPLVTFAEDTRGGGRIGNAPVDTTPSYHAWRHLNRAALPPEAHPCLPSFCPEGRSTGRGKAER